MRYPLKKRSVSIVKKSILVVDDDKSILRSFTHILQRCGYEVDTAETGTVALGKARNRHYDLVLLDVRLPDMKGTDLLVKAKPQLQDTAKIVITGFPSFEGGVNALYGGADAYLIKPVQPQDLLTIVVDKLSHPAAS
jgi:DNA-binding NtrC family response regulator